MISWPILALALVALVVVLVTRERPEGFVLVDPGHGGADPGAVHGGYRESDLNLALAKRLEPRLNSDAFENLLSGRIVRLTRRADHNLAVADRVRMGNETGVIAVVSLHANGYPDPAANGAEVWANSAGLELAERIAARWREGVAELGLPRWRGVKLAEAWLDPGGQSGLWIARVTAPAVLVEPGFMSHPADLAQLIDPARRELIAQVLSAGIADWLRS